jgi:hypothetical protein
MSVAELKRAVDESTPEERLFLAAYLHHKMHGDEATEAADLEEHMRRMDAGDKIPFATVRKLHDELLKAGA